MTTAPQFETATPDPHAYLDRLAASDLGRAYKGRMLTELDLRPGHTVVDLGCGPGTDLAALADAVTGTGRVIGIDHDESTVEEARRRTADRPGVSVHLADVQDLPLPDASADRARTDRVLQHVEDPLRALREIRRVLRPGGRIVLGEPDWGTLAVDHPDGALAQAYTRYVTERAVRNALIGRGLARLAAEAGFEQPEVIPITPVFRELRAADQVLGLERTARRAAAAGYLTEQDAARLLDHFLAGPFLATVTFHLVIARRP